MLAFGDSFSVTFEMLSLRKAINRNAQPYARGKFGLLEKHKDYIVRANGYHEEEALWKIREKAAFRSPDEFYLKMVETKAVGVHKPEEEAKEIQSRSSLRSDGLTFEDVPDHIKRNSLGLIFPYLSTSAIFSRGSMYKIHIRHFSTQQPNHDSQFRLTHKDWLAPNEVLKIFESLNDPSSVLSVLNQYSQRRDYKPTEALFMLVIKKLALGRHFDAIEDIMRKLKVEKPFRFSDDFFYSVIKVYGHSAGRIKKAIETLFEMPEYGCWPSVKTFNFVLNLLVSGKFFDHVHDIYASAPKLGVKIDACCLNILIKGLCENGKLESAHQLLDEFPKQGCAPNVRTFTMLMHGLCARGKVDEAFKLLDKMEVKGIEADTITFNILISRLRKQGKVEEGMQLLERMKQKGCQPNAGSYQEVLYGFLDAQRFLEGRKLIHTMVSEGVSPSFVSYKMLIRGLCDKKLSGDVEWAVKHMVQQGFVPKMGMWMEIIRCVLAGKHADRYILLEEFING